MNPRLLLLPLLLALTGCATVPGERDPRDPWESFNRGMYDFNTDFDNKILKPVAEGYVNVVPQTARTGVSNFFSNLGDVVVLANDLLQFKLRQAASDFSRLVWNSTVGLAGLIDVATPMGLPKHDEDFGQTLGHWGVGSGPYLVLPFLGPSSLRDGTGLAVDRSQFNLVNEVESDGARYTLIGLEAVDTRASLLHTTRLLEQGALDPYLFLRESYLQMRENLVYDGNPPAPAFDLDEFDDLPPDEPMAQ
ncbi:VacJ family lipoprotein [Sulfurivermis fontis]|uniref:MlaA family lipoprotein n=1 Tax=Sulfurivermis fontis TaxID=1972068 RepID=UPI0018D4F93E|nr:VacJ family lipoprotein [Sulfurivermis fontis]